MELFGRILGEESEEWKEEWAAMKVGFLGTQIAISVESG